MRKTLCSLILTLVLPIIGCTAINDRCSTQKQAKPSSYSITSYAVDKVYRGESGYLVAAIDDSGFTAYDKYATDGQKGKLVFPAVPTVPLPILAKNSPFKALNQYDGSNVRVFRDLPENLDGHENAGRRNIVDYQVPECTTGGLLFREEAGLRYVEIHLPRNHKVITGLDFHMSHVWKDHASY